jgi:hypothetical protein
MQQMRVQNGPSLSMDRQLCRDINSETLPALPNVRESALFRYFRMDVLGSLEVQSAVYLHIYLHTPLPLLVSPRTLSCF